MIAAPVIAHRGAPTLAPENTVPALERAAALGAAWVEIDVRVLADGTVIVFHDATLGRCTDGHGAVAEATWDQVRTLDAAAHFASWRDRVAVPRLGDVLACGRTHHLGLNIELKVGPPRQRPALVEGVLAALAETELPREQLLVSSYDATALAAIRRGRDDLQLGLICRGVPRDVAGATAGFAAASVHPEWSRLSRAAVERVRAAGLELYTFTANDPDEVRRLWRWGVDGVITDHPAEMLAAWQARA